MKFTAAKNLRVIINRSCGTCEMGKYISQKKFKCKRPNGIDIDTDGELQFVYVCDRWIRTVDRKYY